jgi:hypothetical protein
MSIQNPLDARDDRYLKLVLGRMYGQDDDAIVQSLEGFDSLQDLYQRISEDGHPICPRCGTTYVDETHCEAQTGKRGQKKSTPPRLRNVGPRKDLPPVGNAAELLKERLEALLRNVELLKHMDESLHGRYFVRQDVDTTPVYLPRAVLSEEEWENLCEEYNLDPNDEGFLVTNTHNRYPGGVARSPSETEAILMAVYAVAGGDMDALIGRLHPDPSSVGAETREEIRQCVEGARADGDKKDGLIVLARQLATWVRGSKVGQGRPSGLSRADHEFGCSITRYRKQGLTDEEIARKESHRTKEDGTSYTTKDVTELGDLGLSWS